MPLSQRGHRVVRVAQSEQQKVEASSGSKAPSVQRGQFNNRPSHCGKFPHAQNAPCLPSLRSMVLPEHVVHRVDCSSLEIRRVPSVCQLLPGRAVAARKKAKPIGWLSVAVNGCRELFFKAAQQVGGEVFIGGIGDECLSGLLNGLRPALRACAPATSSGRVEFVGQYACRHSRCRSDEKSLAPCATAHVLRHDAEWRQARRG